MKLTLLTVHMLKKTLVFVNVILTLIKHKYVDVSKVIRKRRKNVHDLEKLKVPYREIVVMEKEIKSFLRMKMKTMRVIKTLQVVSLDW